MGVETETTAVIAEWDPYHVTGTNQHFQPASVIGGFGDLAGGESLRTARILWRRRESAEPCPITPQRIGFRKGMYRFQDPPSGVDRDRVDEVWDGFETTVPQAIARATKCRETHGDWLALVNYVAAAGVRHPHFEEAVNRWRHELGMPLVAGDGVQVERLAVLARGLLLVRGFRWRFVHSPKNAHRFILNDRGWTYVGEQDRPGRGLFVPLNGRLAMLGWLAPSMSGGFDHLALRPTWVKWLNAATWTDAPEYVVAHPQDGQMLRRLRTADEVASELTMEGAYRRRGGLLFDDE